MHSLKIAPLYNFAGVRKRSNTRTRERARKRDPLARTTARNVFDTLRWRRTDAPLSLSLTPSFAAGGANLLNLCALRRRRRDETSFATQRARHAGNFPRLDVSQDTRRSVKLFDGRRKWGAKGRQRE